MILSPGGIGNETVIGIAAAVGARRMRRNAEDVEKEENVKIRNGIRNRVRIHDRVPVRRVGQAALQLLLESTEYEFLNSRLMCKLIFLFKLVSINLISGHFSVNLLKSRYPSLYVPSDFFAASARWTENFPQHRPLQLAGPSRFHVLDKDVEPVFVRDDLVEPPDADFLFSAKVCFFHNLDILK